MFAGPNGSGKTTLVKILKSEWLGFYLNPDEIQKQIKADGFFDFSGTPIDCPEDEVVRYLRSSTFLKDYGLDTELHELSFRSGRLYFGEITTHQKLPYIMSVFSDYIRRKLIQSQTSFTFETVMSFPDKIELLKNARKQGWRTYLYYVATEDVYVNVARVQQRVLEHGHSVPEIKIRQRYTRSLENLLDAVENVDRAYIFDNSGSEARLVLEVCDEPQGRIYTGDLEHMPIWVTKWFIAKLPEGTRISSRKSEG